jgi:branched-subunit amino acid aminotransferase/4-amino-4-deoxychorismate lyase
VTAKNNILPGVTRRVVIEKLKHGIPVEVRNLKLHELDSATEAFISVSGKGIVPVVVVDDKMIGDGRVGPVTKAVMNKFNEFVASDNW